MTLLLTGANGFVGRYVQAARTFGRDRGGVGGVEIPLAGNHGEIFDFNPIQKERMEKKVRQTNAISVRWRDSAPRRPRKNVRPARTIERPKTSRPGTPVSLPRQSECVGCRPVIHFLPLLVVLKHFERGRS
ncbi:hypothetical protein AFE_1358 [Acidithiobacillus ferrooxidans ATCC 23270]|uniref:Uncharacterized protein n=1 Tax=Acidithiobacillus ferrooxidans (strain ATCC 23270 / DSM 14882 / CIP 104768 / NCIMB 8455) TaxID=243159 RepID=B7J9G2_ACIF2|nr:hypothetical protein AFE_1358 [Acidithiobacillus ferrooxidans ATCC 23270]